jgi:hypothetical protein
LFGYKETERTVEYTHEAEKKGKVTTLFVFIDYGIKLSMESTDLEERRHKIGGHKNFKY